MSARQPSAIELAGPWLDVTSRELCEFVDAINRDEPTGSTISISLMGLSRVLNDPEAIVDLLMTAIGNRCQNDDQILTLMAVILHEAEVRFLKPITSEQLARAAEMLKNSTKAINQQPEEAQ